MTNCGLEPKMPSKTSLWDTSWTPETPEMESQTELRITLLGLCETKQHIKKWYSARHMHTNAWTWASPDYHVIGVTRQEKTVSEKHEQASPDGHAIAQAKLLPSCIKTCVVHEPVQVSPEGVTNFT